MNKFIIIIMNWYFLLISAVYSLAAGDHPDTWGSKRVCYLHANIDMHFNVTVICCSDLYIDSALRRRWVVLVSTNFCISCKFGSPGIVLR